MTVTDIRPEIHREADPFEVLSPLVASSIPLKPPREWFDQPELDGPTPFTILATGQAYGHIAAWATSHIGLPGSIKPPRSRSKYAYFHTGVVACADGTEVEVGQLTLSGGHAPLRADAAAAVAHYDNTKSAVVDMRAGEDRHGIWVAGAVRPSVGETEIRALRAAAPSGDWRPINGGLELVAVCQVNVPGFPIPRALAASAGGELTALVAAGAQDMFMRRLRMIDGAQVERVAEPEARVASLVSLERGRLRRGVKETLRRRVAG